MLKNPKTFRDDVKRWNRDPQFKKEYESYGKKLKKDYSRLDKRNKEAAQARETK